MTSLTRAHCVVHCTCYGLPKAEGQPAVARFACVLQQIKCKKSPHRFPGHNSRTKPGVCIPSLQVFNPFIFIERNGTWVGTKTETGALCGWPLSVLVARRRAETSWPQWAAKWKEEKQHKHSAGHGQHVLAAKRPSSVPSVCPVCILSNAHPPTISFSGRVTLA